LGYIQFYILADNKKFRTIGYFPNSTTMYMQYNIYIYLYLFYDLMNVDHLSFMVSYCVQILKFEKQKHARTSFKK